MMTVINSSKIVTECNNNYYHWLDNSYHNIVYINEVSSMHAISGNVVAQLINEKSLATILAFFVMFLMWNLLKWVMKQQEILMKQSQEREEKLFNLFSTLRTQHDTIINENKTAHMKQRTENETIISLLHKT